jgi:subtilisin family serine protease
MKKLSLLVAALALTSLFGQAEEIKLIDVVVTQKDGSVQLQSVKENEFETFKSNQESHGATVELNPSLMMMPPAQEKSLNKALYASIKSTSVGDASDPELSKQTYLNARSETDLTASNVKAAWELGDQVKVPKIAVLDNGFLEKDRFQDIVVNKSVSFLPAKYGQTGWDESEEELECANGHGLGVASIIGAKRGDGFGIAGIVDAELNFAQVLSCSQGSGTLYNSSQAIRWAAGGEIEGFETLSGPVDVINLSFGAEVSSCPQYMQSAIDFANKQGVLIVAGAGNDSKSVTQFTPANCQGVV